MGITLFDSESQYREKAVQWRIFSMLPLFAPLAGGRIFHWWAINIPMDLGTGGEFKGDLDVIASLDDFPKSRRTIYRTWEVKVGLLCKDGSARSLKRGKLPKVITQLKLHRRFGSPDVSLMDVYLCEAGFLGNNEFLPAQMQEAVGEKVPEIQRLGFGYAGMIFQHGKDKDGDVGLFTPRPAHLQLQPTTITTLAQPFSRLVERLSEFAEEARKPKDGRQVRGMDRHIVFCRNCRELQMIRMKEQEACPNCGDDFIAQT